MCLRVFLMIRFNFDGQPIDLFDDSTNETSKGFSAQLYTFFRAHPHFSNAYLAIIWSIIFDDVQIDNFDSSK